MDLNQKNNQMIFLIAPPRSLSTAFLRMMEARGDCNVFNEPATYLYNQKHYPHSTAYYLEQAKENYEDIKHKLYAGLDEGHVFIKEMSFAFADLITEEESFLRDERVHYVFLLRNPHHCIISYYKKLPAEYMDYMMPVLGELTAYKALHQAYQTVVEKGANQPFLLHAEQLVNDARPCIQAFCQHVQLPFKEDSLSWNSLGSGFTGQREWKEHKNTSSAYHWHQEAILSQGFHRPTDYGLDEEGQPSFIEIQNPAHRAICKDVYRDYLAHYQSMMHEHAAVCD